MLIALSSNSTTAQQRREAGFTLLIGALSIAALFFYYAHRQLLLYGDAVAHINIARRVVDNRHPLTSYGQLGTVWLPLQHIAMLPFVWIEALWRSGIAGSIPSMVAYIVGTLGIFRLVRGRASDLAAYFAAAIYALNPNLLYLQSTAMNEPIFLAFFIWTLVYLDEFLRATSPQATEPHVMPAQMKPERALEACGMTLAGGAYTRYDGWFVAVDRGCRDSVYLRALVAASGGQRAAKVDGEIADRTSGAECAGSRLLVFVHLLCIRAWT